LAVNFAVVTACREEASGKMMAAELRMIQTTDEAKLKKLLKAAMVEVLEERGDLVCDALAEAVEDLGMIQAIREGSRSAPIRRDEVFRILRKRR
jgi:hypothetical protein